MFSQSQVIFDNVNITFQCVREKEHFLCPYLLFVFCHFMFLCHCVDYIMPSQKKICIRCTCVLLLKKVV